MTEAADLEARRRRDLWLDGGSALDLEVIEGAR
jgi:hypothetical protein